MAILESVPGIEVQVLVWGRPLQEYEDNRGPNAETLGPTGCPMVCKYIESIDNAEFVICIKITNYAWGYLNHSLAAGISVDGKWAKAVVFPPAPALMYPFTSKVEGKDEFDPSTNSWFRRRFKFAVVYTGRWPLYPRR